MSRHPIRHRASVTEALRYAVDHSSTRDLVNPVRIGVTNRFFGRITNPIEQDMHQRIHQPRGLHHRPNADQSPSVGRFYAQYPEPRQSAIETDASPR